MSRITITVQGQLGEISAYTFVSVISNTLTVLHDLDRRTSGRPQGTLTWVVAGLRESHSTVVELDTNVRHGNQDYSSRVHTDWLRGLTMIHEEQRTPDWFTLDNMTTLQKMVASLVRNGAHGFNFSGNDISSEITRQSAGPVNALVGVHHKALGSIEGRIELVSVHPKTRRFNIYHAVTNKAIRGNLPPDIEADVFVAAQTRRRVIVSGQISYNIHGEPLSILVQKPMRFLRLEHELPTIEQLLGSDPEITGDLNTEDYIRSLRDG